MPRGVRLNLDELRGIEPLTAQFGIEAPKVVPTALYEVLFGQLEPTQSELGPNGNSQAEAPPLQTYAVLDAAKIPGLPELLAASGLKNSCLFQGDTFDELKDVAPWLVHLKEENSLTRNLFTRSGAQWHLWDKEANVVLRSFASLNVLRSHLRRFTRVQTAQGASLYMRFWEPKWTVPLIGGLPDPDATRFFEHITALIVPHRSGKVAVLKRVNQDVRLGAEAAPNAIELEEALRK